MGRKVVDEERRIVGVDESGRVFVVFVDPTDTWQSAIEIAGKVSSKYSTGQTYTYLRGDLDEVSWAPMEFLDNNSMLGLLSDEG
ncbi:hypothetical protein YC2023_097779 [Brassica napus]